MNCLFCKIINKEIPAQVVYEDERTLAFLDIMPKAPGHTMVMSKTHAPRLVDLPETEVGPLFATVRKIAELLVRVLHADGLTMGINQGEISGQTIPHLHIHLLPRFKGDGGRSIHSVVDNRPAETVENIAKKLKSGL
ncbi:MAG: HIT family protein [Patescibacteria group bacterium]